ncbi:hypothetical protein SELMODRAFT_426019 [Selaginella moellendorffii]|uniref:Uncharacterized protein n=1 Tax=Selaginella moellendorffii TaxID=88036 RepID=D8SV25_SELML|nr:hypothetical protein SELMODRAFT_426019 [Selaginella moellendorffii]
MPTCVIHKLITVCGYKTVVKFFPHQPSELEVYSRPHCLGVPDNEHSIFVASRLENAELLQAVLVMLWSCSRNGWSRSVRAFDAARYSFSCSRVGDRIILLEIAPVAWKEVSTLSDSPVATRSPLLRKLLIKLSQSISLMYLPRKLAASEAWFVTTWHEVSFPKSGENKQRAA